jgi:hypothetical protein
MRSWLSALPVAMCFGLITLSVPTHSQAQLAPVGPGTPTPLSPSAKSAPVSVGGEAATEIAPAGTPASAATAGASATAPAPTVRPSIARVTKGSGTLPNDQGQVWREYDISPYTARVTTTTQPEQAIVDWILTETGYDVWHSGTVAMLSADKQSLRCYHTPEVQAVVAEIVDRFVSSEAETFAFGLRIVTIDNPNWRATAVRLLRPVPVQSPGIQGWLISKEDAALLVSELKKRSDYREHSSPHMLVNNGQSTVVSTMRDRPYTRGILLRGGAWPGYDPDMGKFEEGYALEFNPLLSLDQQTVDAVVKLRLNQVEKLLPVMLEVPTPVAQRQRARIEVPQLTSSNLHERFRWPTDQVLLLSMGVVATPAPGMANPLTTILPIPQAPSRADALLFIEPRGRVPAATAAGVPQTATPGGGVNRRY